ncbi:MAG: DNA-processing protein DprA [Bacillota bacterium]
MINQKLRPGWLLEADADGLRDKLGLAAASSDRMVRLLGRGAQLAAEVERLHSLGIWILTRSDEPYPVLLKGRLGTSAPPVLFGAGEPELLGRGFLAVVGSRQLDAAGEGFAEQIGEVCAKSNHVLVSGGASGADSTSMESCLKAGGFAIAVLADSLERVVRKPGFRAAVSVGRLILVSAVHPKARFSVPNAMARNKYIYSLARYGLVVSSSLTNGGTRAGALEVLKHRWVPLFVRVGNGVPAGNEDLVKRGAIRFPAESLQERLEEVLAKHASAWAVVPGTLRKPLSSEVVAEQIRFDV